MINEDKRKNKKTDDFSLADMKDENKFLKLLPLVER